MSHILIPFLLFYCDESLSYSVIDIGLWFISGQGLRLDCVESTSVRCIRTEDLRPFPLGGVPVKSKLEQLIAVGDNAERELLARFRIIRVST